MRRTNYTDYSRSDYRDNDYYSEPLESAATEEPVKETEEEKPLDIPVDTTEKEGKVVNCKMVNVRVSANGDCPITSVIPEEEVVKVFPSKSTSDYYAVKTDHEIEGFIKKEFIELI